MITDNKNNILTIEHAELLKVTTRVVYDLASNKKEAGKLLVANFMLGN